MSTQEIKSRLKDFKLKETPVRINILSFLSKHSEPQTVSDILTIISANKTTIYREIDKLLTCKLISEIVLEDGMKRYEISTNQHHHFLVCSKCKKIIPIDMHHDFSKTEKQISQKKHFIVKRHNLEFIGLCQKCV